MIIDKYKTIFLHPNKCAGKSVEWILGGKKPEPGSSDHLILKGYRARYGDKVDRYFKFMFCRNPWDRMVSIYFGRTQLYGIKEPPFKEFVKLAKPNKNPTQKQINWIKDVDGKINVDYVGRFEHINEHWDIIRKRLGVTDDLPHANKSKHKPYWHYYDDKTKDIVAEKYAEDINYFKYKFEAQS
jgi:hypothetical protein